MKTTVLPSPFGSWQLWASEQGITRIMLLNERPEEDSESTLPPHLQVAAQQLSEYFAGNRQIFDIPLDWEGHSPFFQSVWKALLEIPFGSTTSYSQIAQDLGQPKAVRAVGMANARNPVPIVVPCHRVIAKDQQLQGYAYGLDLKYRLLQHENPRQYPTQGRLF